MGLLNPPFSDASGRGPRRARLQLERLEDRALPTANAVLVGTTLQVTGGPGNDRIYVTADPTGTNLLVFDGVRPAGTFASAGVTAITIDGLAGDDSIRIDPTVFQPATLVGGLGNDLLIAGSGDALLDGGAGNDTLQAGMGTDTLDGGAGNDSLVSGAGATTFLSGTGKDKLFQVKTADTVAPPGPGGRQTIFRLPENTQNITAGEVTQLLQRAAGATASEDGIIAVVDRGGRILGVRVEGGVSPTITGNLASLTFAIDGAVSLARTGAFFSSNSAPLTSRTIETLSQSTITQREVESTPDDPDPNSPFRGPGFVAPIRPGGHFPPGVNGTPPVDLFGIEHTNRDSIVSPGPDHVKGTADDILLTGRFNIDPAFVPAGKTLFPPESWGFQNGFPNGQSRGIGTLPGGMPLFKNGVLVGGIGVFYPGTTGFADEENSNLGTNYDPNRLDRAREAEYAAFAAAGGTVQGGAPIGTVAGIPALPGFTLPFGRIDLVGITLPIYGPGGAQGISSVLAYGTALGQGNPNTGVNETVDGAVTARGGLTVPDGWLVTPHAGGNLTAADVMRIITNGITEANATRAAIRLPLESRARMVFAVTDNNGNVLGLYRMPDATVFSIDVAVAKARNVAYYADPAQLQPIDMTPEVPPGVAFTNRTFRYLAQPRYPSGQDGQPPGPFSIFNDGNADPLTALLLGARLPASAFQSVYGFDSFNPGSNFHDPFNVANQNGIVFFPGSAPLYGNGALLGGLGVSGDGVDQDDVVTYGSAHGYEPSPNGILRADQFLVRQVRLPYQKFNRNPRG